jgi:hypothetical protein
MMELLRLFGEIALLRRGPQDIPASLLLLLATVFGYAAVNALMSLLLPPVSAPWFLPLVTETLFLLVWCAVLLRLTNRPERYLQTATALLGYQTLLSPPLDATMWLMSQVERDSVWVLPVLVIALALLVWLIAVGGHVFKAALEWSMPASVGIMILQLISVNLLVAAIFTPLS